MTDEIYDVIDREGNKIKTATWTECHTQGLLHQGVSILVFKDKTKKETLLQRRSLKLVQEPGKWQHAAAGHLNSGLMPKEGALKELREELFSDKNLPEKLVIKKIGQLYSHDLPGNFELIHVYEAIYPGPFFYSRDEVEEQLKWTTWEELLREIDTNPNKFAKFSKSVIKEYCKIKATV